ncbi:MAG: FHA domain-containing protein, partial [Polyangiaceae bacterium]
MAHDPSDQETTLDDAIDVASLEGRRHLTLLVVSGPAAGQWHLVPAQGGVIGRHPECDVMVADPAVSRRQAKVTLRD